MNEAHLINELSESLGQRVSRVAPEYFDLIFGVFRNLGFIGIEERFAAMGDIPDAPVYSVDEDGKVESLYLDSLSVEQIPILRRLQHLKLLGIESSVEAEVARELATLPGLEYLSMSLSENSQRVLDAIGEVRSLKGFLIEKCRDPIDIGVLSKLPNLETLLLTEGRQINLESLSCFPSLRHLLFEFDGDGSHLADLTELKSLGFKTTSNDKEYDFGFLAKLVGLRRLIVPDVSLPISVLRRLPNLKALALVEYSHTSLDPLSGLGQLEELFLGNSKLSNLSELTAFKRLKILDLQGCEIQDISDLQGQATIEYLNLSRNPITQMPPRLGMALLQHLIWEADPDNRISQGDFLADCPQLTTLNLSRHRLQDTGFLGPLGNLRFVDLSGNDVEDLSPVADLVSLEALNISHNRVRDLIPLADCSALTKLNANHNPIQDPAGLSRLRTLEYLNLQSTGIRDLDFTKRLRNLYSLDLSRNAIASMEPLLELPNLAHVDLSGNQLSEIPPEILERRGLVSLTLKENPLQGISPELYSGDGRETLSALRDYYRGLARGRMKHDQVKLLLVGNGRVGKTSVVGRLLDDEFDPDQPSTHGIQLRRWQLDGVARDKLDGQPLKVDVWDFGGQDIYHATHRLFMKTRALFLLVWDRETEVEQYSIDELGQRYENFRLTYWIDYIKALSHSPVIIVQNKVDSLTQKDPAYGLECRALYPPPNGVLDYQHVSAKRDSQNGMPGLRSSIAQALENLESIGYSLPAQWVEVRDRLLAMDNRYLEYDRYAELCASVGMQPGEDMSLAGFLHQAGAVFYQPKDFGERLILDQKWAIEAVYALFDRRGGAYADLQIAARHGLTLEMMKRKVWQHFSAEEHELLLEFMKSCEICFEFSEGLYYVPQLLPEEMPQRVQVRWPVPTEHSMRIDYAFLHRAIIERFLVRAGLLGADEEPEIWRNGIVIYDPGSRTEALVEAHLAENQITAYATAKDGEPIQMLQMIRREFDELHQDFPATVAFSADGGRSYVELDKLRQYAEAGSVQVPTTEGILTDLAPLTGFLDTREQRLPKGRLKKPAALSEPAGADREIFVSYAWGDPEERGESREAIVDRLYDAMADKPYKLIRDKKDNMYRMLISDFMRRIGRGRLVVVVISDKYLKSPYCMFELLEIYEHGQFQQRVFPIVLADAKLYDLEDRLQYLAYWKKKKKKIENQISEIGPDAFAADGAFNEYHLYYRRVFNNIDKITSLIKDWNAMTPKVLEENNFAMLLGEVEAALE